MDQKLLRTDWIKEEIRKIYEQPLLELVFQAAQIHRQFHNPQEVQMCTLLSIKTGGCPEDCAYCPQSARYQTDIEGHALLSIEEVLQAAHRAKEAGSTRFCMGSAWRRVRDSNEFDTILSMVKKINALDMEVCCTLGTLSEEQACKLKNSGLHAYNHNLDTGREYYSEIITTRTYDERLETLENVRKADISVCCGGIIGMGETAEDRLDLLHTLATLPEHPESVPVNCLIPVKGTPLENQPMVPIWDLVRMIATARIIMPKAMVRLSAGRVRFSPQEQAFCFMAGANSIFTGEKLLTTPNNDFNEDVAMLNLLGLTPRPSFKKQQKA